MKVQQYENDQGDYDYKGRKTLTDNPINSDMLVVLWTSQDPEVAHILRYVTIRFRESQGSRERYSKERRHP